ncbi:hypothetical protein MSAN_00795200 [Mycena sanguinolenta]|uniref:Uncharacterized protein n=1 Tax=Mycena sanguinolenta TaxID=230812 RepID=A0A8H7DAH7_9AGAR|nr:hypothetical protein MSAN_00795200 [Mycena sanguinolenta]
MFLSVIAGAFALLAAYIYFFGIPPAIKRDLEEKALKTMGENKASYLVKGIRPRQERSPDYGVPHGLFPGVIPCIVPVNLLILDVVILLPLFRKIAFLETSGVSAFLAAGPNVCQVKNAKKAQFIFGGFIGESSTAEFVFSALSCGLKGSNFVGRTFISYAMWLLACLYEHVWEYYAMWQVKSDYLSLMVFAWHNIQLAKPTYGFTSPGRQKRKDEHTAGSVDEANKTPVDGRSLLKVVGSVTSPPALAYACLSFGPPFGVQSHFKRVLGAPGNFKAESRVFLRVPFVNHPSQDRQRCTDHHPGDPDFCSQIRSQRFGIAFHPLSLNGPFPGRRSDGCGRLSRQRILSTSLRQSSFLGLVH